MENRDIIVTYDYIQNDDSFMALLKSATEQGVFADFFHYKKSQPFDKDSSLYFVVSPTIQELLDLREHPEDFKNILEKKKQIGRHSINPYYEIVRLDDYYRNNNYFKKYMDCCRAIEDVSIVKSAFYEFGYTLPTEMSKRTIQDMWDFDQRRRSTTIPEHVRQRYEKSYEKYISEINQRYKKLSLAHEKSKHPVSQTVGQNYFHENRVEAVHDAMNQYFRAYFEQRIKDYPDFIYSIEKKPSLNLKDLSKKIKVPENENIWKNDVELKEYNVMFPKAQEEIYYKILLEYNCRNYAGQSKELYMLGEPTEITTITIDMDDMWNWNSLCTANHVPYYINHGELEQIDALATRNIKIAYNNRDERMVNAICSRLANNRREYRCTTADQRKLAEQNKPQQHKNPFVRNQLEMNF